MDCIIENNFKNSFEITIDFILTTINLKILSCTLFLYIIENKNLRKLIMWF